MVLEEVRPDPALTSQFIIQRTSERASQASFASNISDCNTDRHDFVCQEMYHGEGGWAKDFDHTDSGQLMRWQSQVITALQVPNHHIFFIILLHVPRQCSGNLAVKVAAEG